MPLGEGGTHERGDERGAPPTLKSIILYSTIIASSNVKMVADWHTHMLLIITSTADELLWNVKIDDFESP